VVDEVVEEEEDEDQDRPKHRKRRRKEILPDEDDIALLEEAGIKQKKFKKYLAKEDERQLIAENPQELKEQLFGQGCWWLFLF
jgi:hypothetical protein